MPLYYSNWNRNHKSGLKNLTDKILRMPKTFWDKFRTEKSLRRKIFLAGMYLGAGVILLGSVTFAAISLTLPDPNKLNDRLVAQSTRIYARDGTTLLYEVHGEAKRTLIKLDDVPDYAKQASIAIEDKNFYRNPGVDWRGILRSVWIDITNRKASQGGSTITQQFVRNAILTREKTFTRKIKEAVLAIEIGQKFSKDEILQLYLNEIPYGQNAYGIEAASQTYFGKHAHDITLAEAAYLAALPQAPTFYNPNGPHRQALDARHEIVLDQMYDQGYITKDQRDNAKKEVVTFGKIRDAILAPHFVLYVEDLLAQKYGEKTLEEGGLKVVTTLDWNMQQAAEKAVKDGVARNEKYNKAENASLVAQDPKTGQILAMVGSRDYFDDSHDGQVNVALQELQPGSSIKPYIYATAFKKGMSPATMLVDVKTVFGTYGGKEYAPGNYDGTAHGIVNIRKAMAGSLNIPAVKTLALVGVQNAIDTAKDMGITSDINTDRCGLSLVLGGCEVKLIDHVEGMSTFANLGVKQDQTPILSITDSKGVVLEEFHENPGQQVLDPQIAYQIISIMTDNEARAFVFGDHSPLILPDRVVAAKTGTTNEWRDGWTLGYTPSLAAGVWVGNNDHSKMRAGADGVVVAAPIWNQFMREALKGTTPEQFTEPPGIQHIMVDTISGKLPTEYTPSTKSEVFSSFGLPQEFDDVHVAVRINKYNGKLANNLTPADAVVTRVYTVIHSEMPDNPNWEVPVRLWAGAAGYGYPPTEQDDGSVNPDFINQQTISFITPANNQEITNVPFSVQVNAGNSNPTAIDLLLDNEFIGTKTTAPYSYTIAQAKNGWQTLTANVHLPNGGLIQSSIRININKP
ncbi:MAG: PBP1A family penicillin-binding protein [Candidatus Doudnabacteria bacterium]|nr:PBP1A family penicillin-binding protein [Candidatus Doudnabacteria bacterium]